MNIVENVEDEYNEQDQGTYQQPEKLNDNIGRSVFFDSNNLPQVECYYHKGYYISNMCRAPQCVIPLCPLCIHLHSKEHVNEGTYPVFESLEVLLNQASDHVNNELKKFTNSYYDIKKHVNTFEVHAEKTIKRIREIKKRITDVVEQFFSGLENEVEHKQKKNVNNQERDARNLLQMIEERWSSMKQMLVTFQSSDCLTALIPYFTTTFQEDNQVYYKKIGEYINAFPTVSSEVHIDQHRASELSLFLQSIIRVQHTSIPDFIGIHQLPTTNVTESTKIKSLQGSRIKEPLRVTIPEKKTQFETSQHQYPKPPTPVKAHRSPQHFHQSLPLHPGHPPLPIHPQYFPQTHFIPPYHRF
ncbi:unnamed protein product (macronuclear) [Paramecium tetraurelia]|uniref:B box-type domain-containing protein n=1 Tax=Paramecium tetraurelia TaxID=5888 RepID=A0CB74_PARTE|nr:uncharacterized protein GSPATT00036824001 [Paramecium tetraurelia]CAK68041.1 unnamed protein product [Paramecium tetraurelia]|eukprot:XP_001435438.1 hypothetical protein (macronuclear) [Paramecium tetraurelia strain d4-2]